MTLSSMQLFRVTALNDTAASSVSCDNSTQCSRIVNSVLSGRRSTISCNSSVWSTKKLNSSTSISVYPSPSYTNLQGVTLNPCDPLSSYNFYNGILVLLVNFRPLQMVPTIKSVKMLRSYSNSVSLQVNTSAKATVYCSAFPLGSAPGSVDEIVLSQLSAVTRGNTSAVSVLRLQPLTAYSLYCATVSTFGFQMSLPASLSTRLDVTTACCKAVVISISTQSFAATTAIPNFATVALSDFPSNSVDIAISITPNKTIGAQNSPFYPSVTTVRYSKTSSLSFAADLNQVPIGLYNITVVISGPSASEYFPPRFASGNAIRAYDAAKEPPVPKFQRATFSNDGSFVLVSFDSATNRAYLGATFPCSQLFSYSRQSSSGTGSGSGSTCIWQDDAVVALYPSPDLQLNIGDLIVLSSAALKPKCTLSIGAAAASASAAAAGGCSNWTATTPVGSKTIITAPSMPTNPSVVISAPSVIGSCDSLLFDLSGSSGSAGRGWNTSIRVDLIPSTISGAASTFRTMNQSTAPPSLVRLRRYMLQNYSVFPVRTVPRSLFVPGTYVFSVQLCNFLSSCGSAQQRVTVAASLLPSVTVLGDSVRVMNRSQALAVSSAAFTATCEGDKVYANLSYAWSLFVGSTPILSEKSLSKDTSKFKLSPFALQTNLLYTVKLTVTYTALLVSASDSIQV